MTSPSIQQQRSRILEEMALIDRMIRGHVSQQTYEKKRGDHTTRKIPLQTVVKLLY